MSQLVVPGRNAARQAKKLKEIRKVKHAIQWHEKERKKRQELKQEQWDSKQAVIQRIMWENEHVHQVRKKALANAKEDWKLGPLRPNRAIGPGADKYGALTGSQMQKPEIPTRTQKNRNEIRAKKGLELEYPLVVKALGAKDKDRGKKYFPIVKDDRVAILKGKDQGKIGVVQEIIERTHEVIIKGLNMQYYDSDVFTQASEEMGPKHENEVPLPMDHVRLVIPSEVIEKKKEGDAIVDAIVYKDVIVEKIFMERHTTGIDPYTGTDYGDAEIPEEHQYDPRNGSPIFHRYIAGTQHRLKWPWEREEDVRDVGKTEEDNTDNQTRLRKVGSAVAAPWQSLKRWRESRNKEARTVAVKAKSTSKEFSNIEEADALEDKKAIPRAKDSDAPEAYDGVDTTRNVVFDAESVAYTLVAPPFPDTLGEELRGHIHDFSIQAKKEASKDPDAPRFVKTNAYSEKSLSTMQKVREATRQRLRAAQAMKTPMQLRWELAQRSKAERMKKSPLVDEESLLVALGGHMAKKSGKPYLGKKEFGSQTADLD